MARGRVGRSIRRDMVGFSWLAVLRAVLCWFWWWSVRVDALISLEVRVFIWRMQGAHCRLYNDSSFKG